MKTLVSWALVATIVFGVATLAGCKKENITSNSQCDAETLIFKVNNSSYEFIMKKVDGGDYSMVYMYDDQEKTVTGTLSDFYICQTETMNYIWETVMGSIPQGQTGSDGLYPVTMVNYADNAGQTSHFVASKQPNELGLYDLSGNVWEYCNDWYADLADLPAEQGLDYTGPESGEVIVGCGGCYESAPHTCTSAYHGREIEHNGRNATVGFRIVLR